jgi:hypothetical protein
MIRAVVDVINAFEFMVGPVLLLRVGSDFYRLQRTCPPAAGTSTIYEKDCEPNVRSLSATTNSTSAPPCADYGGGITAVV